MLDSNSVNDISTHWKLVSHKSILFAMWSDTKALTWSFRNSQSEVLCRAVDAKSAF